MIICNQWLRTCKVSSVIGCFSFPLRGVKRLEQDEDREKKAFLPPDTRTQYTTATELSRYASTTTTSSTNCLLLDLLSSPRKQRNTVPVSRAGFVESCCRFLSSLSAHATGLLLVHGSDECYSCWLEPSDSVVSVVTVRRKRRLWRLSFAAPVLSPSTHRRNRETRTRYAVAIGRNRRGNGTFGTWRFSFVSFNGYDVYTDHLSDTTESLSKSCLMSTPSLRKRHVFRKGKCDNKTHRRRSNPVNLL